jgi:hypothetical protein
MKLSLKDNLKKFNLITEGWAEDISDKYSEDILIFVGRMLQMAYPNEDISSHPLAEWIAKTSKALGEMPWSEPKKSNLEKDYQVIINFVKNNDDRIEIINNIKNKNLEDALKYVEEESDDAIKQIEKFELEGLIKIVEKTQNKIWVEVLNSDFFKKVCENNSNFGIACQITSESTKFVGGDRRTYTLLGKENKGDKSYFITLSSISLIGKDRFFEIKQPGNAFPGQQNVGSYSGQKIAEETVNFIINSPFLEDYNVYVDFFNPNNVPIKETKYGGASTFAWWLKNKPELITRIIQNNEKVLDAMEPLIRVIKPDFLELINIDLLDISKNKPDAFFNKLKIYLGVDRNLVIDILNNFNYKEYIDNFTEGKENIEKNLMTIMDVISYDIFNNNIKKYIDFKGFISKLNDDEIKEFIRKVRNKFDKNIKYFMQEFNKLFPFFIEGFGGDSSAFAKVFNVLNVPRLDKHQNYTINSSGEIIALVEEPVIIDGSVQRDSGGRRITQIKSKEIKDDDLILGKKLTKTFLKNHKDSIIDLLPGNDISERELNYNRMLFKNMSLQEKESLLKEKKDEMILQFDEKYKSGKSNYPGFIAFNLLKEPKVYVINSNSFNEGVKSYKFNKKDFKENIPNLLKYYFSKSNSSSKKYKVIDSIVALVDNAINSNISNEDINQYIFQKFNPINSKILGGKENLNYDDISYFVNSITNIDGVNNFKLNINELINLIESEEVENIVKKDSSKFQSTTSVRYEDLKNKLKKIQNLNENKIRRYIQNLLNSNFRIK